MKIAVLALDLEATLIDDAHSAKPRPGLYAFLVYCLQRFPRVAIFTTVETAEARAVLTALNRTGHVPTPLLERLEYVEWTGEYKDFAFVRDADPSEVVLVDDDAHWVRPDQRERWIPVIAWDGGRDRELERVRVVLERLLAEE